MERERRLFIRETGAKLAFAACVATVSYASVDMIADNSFTNQRLATQGMGNPSEKAYDLASDRERICKDNPAKPGCVQDKKTIEDFLAHSRLTPRTTFDLGLFGLGAIFTLPSIGTIYLQREQRRNPETPAPPQSSKIIEGTIEAEKDGT